MTPEKWVELYGDDRYWIDEKRCVMLCQLFGNSMTMCGGKSFAEAFKTDGGWNGHAGDQFALVRGNDGCFAIGWSV